MRTPEIEQKLTAAARQALEDLVDDYRNRILVSARESASTQTGEMPEISVHDILTAVQRGEIKRASSGRFEIILRLYAILGITMGFVGTLIFLYNNFLFNVDIRRSLPLVLGILGFAIAIASFSYLSLRRSRVAIRFDSPNDDDFRKADSSMLFIKRWQDIELAIRNLVATRTGESTATEPISLLIKQLVGTQELSPVDEAHLMSILSLRNKIIHEGYQISGEEFEAAIKGADRILGQIHSKRSTNKL